MTRTYCDSCDCDLTGKPYVTVTVHVPFDREWQHIKPTYHDLCSTCATAHRIVIEERPESL